MNKNVKHKKYQVVLKPEFKYVGLNAFNLNGGINITVSGLYKSFARVIYIC